jgi:ribosome-associated protein
MNIERKNTIMDIKNLHQELKFRMSRSSGSGGQHVNKVSTRVELLFDVPNSEELNEQQKAKILKLLDNRINKEGILIVASEASRSQFRNKSIAIKKFEEMVGKALRHREVKRKAGAFKANKKKRLKAKRRHAEKKAMRKKVVPGKENNLF